MKQNLSNNDKTSMDIILEEGREPAREHQAQDLAIKLDFQWANADKNCTQTSPGKLNVTTPAAIVAGEDALHSGVCGNN